MLNIKCLGAAKIVTGSCHLVEADNKKFLIDCGMFQGPKKLVKKNYEDFLFNAKEIEFLILTHAHIDHSGLIPKLVKYGFEGTIYCSPPTGDLLPIMLEDSAHIQQMDTMHENRRRERQGLEPRDPLYEKEHAQKAIALIKKVDYENIIPINENISFSLHDAGHIIGSSMIELIIKDNNVEKNILFSGDIGQWNVPIIRNPFQVKKCDYLFVESTYGDRLHKERVENHLSREEILLDIIKKTTERGGKTLIPSFAIERTQEILYSINKMVKQGIFPDIKVYVDSPLAIRATEVFKKHTEVYDKEASELKENPFEFKNLVFTLTAEESMQINEEKEPSVIIAGSGMCNAGRIRHHLKHNLWKKETSVVFVGYQAEGTLGRYILEKADTVKMMGMKIKVNAEIHKINAFSSHADYSEIIQWLKNFEEKPKKAFIIHGEEKSAQSLYEKITEIGINAYIPSIGEELF
ncbi:MAG: MBL fold metallo-hydrolase [Candidatus Muirbacterium halophilum]|nr:MBL fold metallo-hydrolase [Candidatus Muirbacterium halophilum]MCK9477625.1 MBL fold metallo-hydrolase [Candidatus Muirbacterium halophilum]